MCKEVCAAAEFFAAGGVPADFAVVADAAAERLRPSVGRRGVRIFRIAAATA